MEYHRLPTHKQRDGDPDRFLSGNGPNPDRFEVLGPDHPISKLRQRVSDAMHGGGTSNPAPKHDAPPGDSFRMN